MGSVNTDEVIKRARSYEGLSILEIGPRYGNHSKIFLHGGAEKLVMIEPRQDNIDILKDIIGKEHKVIIHHTELTHAEIDSTFDLVTACGVICHTSNPMKFIEQMKGYGSDFIVITHFSNEKMNGPYVNKQYKKERYKGKIYTEDQREDNRSSRGSVEEKDSFWPTLESLRSMFKFSGYTIKVEHILENEEEPLVYLELHHA